MDEKRMFCGAARCKITPPREWMPDLRGLQNVIFSEVLDDLYVRVLAVRSDGKTLLIVTFDCDKVPCPERFLDALERDMDIPKENIMLLAIHTHTAPIAGWRPGEGPNFIMDKPPEVQAATHVYEDFLEQKLLEAAKEAIQSLQPARIGWQEGECLININRVQDYHVRGENGEITVHCGLGRNPEAFANRRLFVMKAETPEGRPIAFLINYAVHNCIMIKNLCGPDGGTLLSSDLGGNVSQMLEKAYPGSVALWTSGAAGDLNPILTNEIYYPDPETGAQKQYIIPAGDRKPIEMLQKLSAQHYEDVSKVIKKIQCGVESGKLGAGVAWAKTPGSKEDDYEVRVQLMEIGGLWIAGFSGELYSSLGQAVLEELPKDAIVMNHDATLMAQSGYIFDDETWERDRDMALPGRRASGMLPGYIRQALKETVRKLYETVQSGLCTSLQSP